jgi:hypothetical protein
MKEKYVEHTNLCPELSKLDRTRKVRQKIKEVACLGSIPVLTSRGAVKIDDDFEAMCTSPCDCIQEIRQLSLDVWFTRPDLEGPITNGYPNMVETGSPFRRKARNVRRRWTNPAAAMAAKSASVIQVLQCLIKAVWATARFWYKQKVHSSMILSLFVLSNTLGVIHDWEKVFSDAMQTTLGGKRTSSTSHPPRLTPRTFCEP